MKNFSESSRKQISIDQNFHRVLDRIAAAARANGRDPEDVRLVVVTKGHPVEVVQAAIEAGARMLGENYVEEALPKMEGVSGSPEVSWHMIGHIQSRKARAVAENFDFVHSVDRVKVARRLNRYSKQEEQQLPVLLELNVSGEESKYGWPAWNEEKVRALRSDIETILEFSYLELQGLMTMAPFFSDAEEARPYFKRLRKIQQFLYEEYPQADWRELSMGMSADFEVAIQEGATIVRIGTAVLGERP